MMLGQFCQAMPAGCHSHGPCADGTSTANVQRRISNHPDVVRPNRTEESLDFLQRFASYIVAVEVTIAKADKSKVVRQSEEAKLYLCPRTHVARQKADGHIRTSVEMNQQFSDAGQDTAGVQIARQIVQIGIAQTLVIFWCVLDKVQTEQIGDDSAIGAAA